MQAIFHAHNWSFNRIRTKLGQLHSDGFDAIQISPAQKSPAGAAWYLRYQPFDHLEIEGLGDQRELANLCAEARMLGMTMIADLVFNHMSVPDGVRREQWQEAEQLRLSGDQRPIERLYEKLELYPHLTKDDFQPWRDMTGPDWDNEHRYESWGNGEWPELKPTENVISLHERHIKILYDCGVRGFRFDAVKHMRASHLGMYMKTIDDFAESCWCYGEVFSGDPQMHAEYDHLFPTTDFPFIQQLKKALHCSNSFHLNPDEFFLSPKSIRFGLNHDLVLNPFELVSGFRFHNDEHTSLANHLALLLAGGTALVYVDDYEKDKFLPICLDFRRKNGGVVGPVEVCKIDGGWEITGSRHRLTLDLKHNRLR